MHFLPDDSRTVGSWVPAASMQTGRVGHCAALLPNGSVLVAGGATSAGAGRYSITATAEVYSPESDSWKLVADLGQARERPVAAVLTSGRVLVAGGGDGDKGAFRDTELYDPGRELWIWTGQMAQPRTHHAAALLSSGRVLVAGGYAGNVLATVESYDPTSGLWEQESSLKHRRSLHTATRILNDRVLVAGGSNLGLIVAESEIYDPASGDWASTGSLSIPRYGHCAVAMRDGTVLVAGGVGILSPSARTTDMRLHEPSGNRANTLRMTLPRPLASAESYDPLLGNWTEIQPMHFAHQLPTATLLAGGQVLVVSGSGAEVYDPGAGTWTAAPGMNAMRGNHTATLLLDGRVLVTGGGQGAAANTAELYQPIQKDT